MEQYQPKSVEDMQHVLKDIFGPMFESTIEDIYVSPCLMK